MYNLRRIGIAIILIIISWFALSALKAHLDPNTDNITEEDAEDAAWISTSKYWLDRQSCRWIGICGVAHWHPDPAAKPWTRKRVGDKRDITSEEEEEMLKAEYYDWTDIPDDGERLKPGDWDGNPTVLKDVPQFVLDHAPLIHLYSGEKFWPSDIREHILHMDQYTNHTIINETAPRCSLNDLHQLNAVAKGKYLFMHSQDDVEERPDWLGSAYNKPVPYDDEEEEEEVEEYTEYTPETPEERATWFDLNPASKDNKVAAPFNPTFQNQAQNYRSRRKRSGPMIEKPMPAMPKPGGYSPAPAILVLVDKGHGILDAFWFYFYSYNLGTTVLGMRFGNHVGDWEHSLIRFHNGVPKAIFFSAHSGGIAYSYNAVEKGKGKGRDGRPILYSAIGSHAMYATPGLHPYVLPFGLLADVTDKGPLWDPALHYLAYHFNTSITHDVDAKSFLRPSASNPTSLSELQAQKLAESFQPASDNPKAPVGWWWYKGHWGDKFYELRDERQWRFAGQYHYVNGPLGPRFKNLGRARVCQSRGSCIIVEDINQKRDWLGR